MMRPPVPCGVSVQVRIEEEEEEEGSEIFYFSLFIVNLFYLQPFQHEKKKEYTYHSHHPPDAPAPIERDMEASPSRYYTSRERRCQ